MKKLLISIFTLLFITCAADASTLKMTAEILEPFDSTNPPKSIKTRVVGDYVFSEKEKIHDGCIFEGDIVEIVEPKRGKRDGYFYYRLTSYTKPSQSGDDHTVPINNYLVVKVKLYKPFDKKEAAISAGTFAAGLFVDHISYPINFARGAYHPVKGKGRMASGAQMVYEKSPLAYISKGDPMLIETGDKITLVFTYDKE